MVLAKNIVGACPDLGGEGLEALLLWLLQGDLSTCFDGSKDPFGCYIDSISQGVCQFFEDGNGDDNLVDLANKLRTAAYELGTPRQLLFGDIIAAVLRKKIQNSCWQALPLYTGLSRDKWLHVLQKEPFIKGLWPAQHLLGQADILKGKSAIVQMPTSAGKTKANELIIRSAFLAERTSMAIIVAPFRALCHEIKNSLISAFHNETTKVNELSDALQTDFEISELLGHQQILVVTPEKLLYVLRRAPELASSVGLLIFDEGHQFDSGTRGITYELLLTSLRSMLPEGAQKVLMSAVISNAKAVGEWLNDDPKVVEGINLNPTFRSVGFASWLDQLGRIEYVDSENAEHGEFFVPRIIESYKLEKKPREKKERTFPEKSDGQAIALYLGLKLAPNGSVAVFCGRKSTATSICEKAVETIKRGIPIPLPQEFSDQQEVERLLNLHIKNLGPDALASKSTAHGIFSHHGNTPHGIRLAVEYAMRENLVRFVVCTSTLAQGVDIDRISYCDIRDEEFFGQNNISQNPMFVNPNKGNYHLKKESPCRDTGNQDVSYKDLDGSYNDIGADGGPWGVKDIKAPIIKEIIITPPNGKTGEEISFAAEADDEWGIAIYSWDFDDSDGIQEDALGEKVFHTYEYEGNYIVTLTVEDNSGLKHMDTKEIIISVDGPPAPPKILSISTSPSTPCGNVPLDVLVNVDAVDTDGYIVSYELYLSDSNEIIADSKDKDISFTIDRKIIKPEAFEISVCVTDNDGLKDYDSIPITLLPPGDHIESSGMIGIEGGKIEVSDLASNLYGVKASIPKNALFDDYVITISTIKACPPFPDQCIGIGPSVDFGPSIKFNSPLTITIPYDSNELEANGISPGDNLKIYFYDILQSKWRSIENSKIDLENECVSARISHFTLFKIGYDNGVVIDSEENGCFINTLFTNFQLTKNK